MKHLRHRTALTILALVIPAALFAAEKANVDYPTGYRDWTHVKSMVRKHSTEGVGYRLTHWRSRLRQSLPACNRGLAA